MTAPDRGELTKAKKLFSELIAQWTKLLFSTGDLVASEEGWETMGKLTALFPIVETKAIAPLSEIENDLERIERLFLSGKSPDPDSVIYGLKDEKEGGLQPVLTAKMIDNYAAPELLELAGYQLWHVLPEALDIADVGVAKSQK